MKCNEVVRLSEICD